MWLAEIFYHDSNARTLYPQPRWIIWPVSWRNWHNIWPFNNICGHRNLVRVQKRIRGTGRLSKALGDESKVVHGQALEPGPRTWPTWPIHQTAETTEECKPLTVCLVLDRACLKASKYRAGASSRGAQLVHYAHRRCKRDIFYQSFYQSCLLSLWEMDVHLFVCHLYGCIYICVHGLIYS